MRRGTKWLTSGVALIVATGLLLGTGFYFGFGAGQNVPQRVDVNVVNTDNETAADFAPFWETWGLIDEKYLEADKVSDAMRVEGAVAGLVAALDDPYSEFFSPEDAKRFKEDVEGNFSGMGAEIGIRKGRLVIIAPLKGSPAEAAGILPGDQILMINATSTADIGIDVAVRFIRGEPGTELALTIMRDSFDAPREFTIIRQPIVAPTLDMEMLPGGIAYIELYSFNANAGRLFYDAIRRAALADARGVVLDLRGNPGGYLEVAVDLAGWFLKKGTLVVSEEGREGAGDKLYADGNAALAKIPTVVLIDEGSASASEILAGALRDQRNIKLVGQTSFGKGSVQEYMDLLDGSIVKLTIAHWVLPKGGVLDKEGLKPDFEVELTDEDIEAERDPQKGKAIEVLREQMR